MGKLIYSDVESFDFKGLKIKELTPASETSASIAEIEVPPGGTHPMARSTVCDKTYMCIEGRVEFICDELEQDLSRFDVLHIPKMQWFSYVNKETVSARLVLFHVPPFDMEHEEFKPEADE